MNNDHLSHWLTLGANIGVLIGIILLLVELNQTQEIARAEIRNEIYQGVADVLSMIDSDTAAALTKVNGGQELDPVEGILLSRWAETMMRYWENSHYQYEMGMYDESQYSTQQNAMRKAITALFPAALVPHYCQNTNNYSTRFVAMVGDYVTPEICAGYEERDYQ